MTMPDLFEQLDSPAENGDDWIRRLLSEPDETPSPTPAAGDDGTDTGHEPDLPQEEERIVPPQASGPGAGGDVTAPPPSGAHAIPCRHPTTRRHPMTWMTCTRTRSRDSAPIWMPTLSPVRSMPAGSY